MTERPADLLPRAIAELVEALARFSAPGPGVTRFVYDEAWCEAHAWLAERAEESGLAATRDAAGNLYLHDPSLVPHATGSATTADAAHAAASTAGVAASPRAAAPVFLTGSHLDTVREGGALDGAYGALAGLMLAGALRGKTRVPVAGLITCEEEGSRFANAFLGARAMVGRVAAGESDTSRDAAGVSWRDALSVAAACNCAAPGGVGSGPVAPFAIAGFLELHIEQGPVLETEGLALGIVDRIAGFHRVRATLTGEARHAGTTPMRMRRDALAAAAEITLAVERIAREQGEPAVATVGAADARPGLYYVVAGSCELRIDLRHAESGSLGRLAYAIEASAREIAARRHVELKWELVSRQNPISMNSGFVETALKLAGERGIAHRRMASGAGHDAMIFAAAGIPSLMLFVPSRGGISHSPDELTTPRQLAAGIEFARELLPRLAERMPGEVA